VTIFLFIISFVFAFILLAVIGKGQKRYENYQKEMNDKEGGND